MRIARVVTQRDRMAVTDARAYAADGLLCDGISVRVRAIRPDDRGRLVAFFGRLSTESIYYRFFGAKKRLTDDEYNAGRGGWPSRLPNKMAW